MKKQRTRSFRDFDPSRMRQREVGNAAIVIPDDASPEERALLEERIRERNEARADRYARFTEINPSLGSPSPITNHPRELRGHEMVSREFAIETLGDGAPYFTKMVRHGVIRKAHPDLFGQYLWRDVAALASTEPGTPERAAMERRLRLRNTSEYLIEFLEPEYYDIHGLPLDRQSMVALDAAANDLCSEGLAGPAVKFRPLLRPVPRGEVRDHKTEHEIQFLYLHDEDIPLMTTALSMRRWYTETHANARYHVNRISIPPVEYLGHPQHRGVLKFLVQCASNLFGVDFETMPVQYYDAIMEQEQRLSVSQTGERMSLANALTGARVTDESDLHTLLLANDPDACLPLRVQAAIWYQAYKNLVTPPAGTFPEFKIRRQAYLDSILVDLEAVPGGKSAEVLQQIEVQMGCAAGWATKYRPETPPSYIGQPPGYAPPEDSGEKADPLRRHIHPRLRNQHLPVNLAFLMGQNSLEDATPEHIEAAERISPLLDKFHRAIAAILPVSASNRKDRAYMSRLFALLREEGIAPRSLYLYPYRDADLLDKVISESGGRVLDGIVARFEDLMAEEDGVVLPERSPTALVEYANEVPIAPESAMSRSPVLLEAAKQNINNDTRLDFAFEFAVAKLSFTEQDLEKLTAEEILSGFGEHTLASLDEFILEKTHPELVGAVL